MCMRARDRRGVVGGGSACARARARVCVCLCVCERERERGGQKAVQSLVYGLGSNLQECVDLAV
jgi:hypothetical protein